MKICWLLGLLCAALCEGNDVTGKDEAVYSTTPSKTYVTSDLPSEPPPKYNKTLTKRQAVLLDDSVREESQSLPSSVLTEKRATKFSSWAGKRGPDESNEIKRATKFSSWAGKRSDGLEDALENSKRAKFSSWSGKRSDFQNKRILLANALAGYSNEPYPETNLLYENPNNDINEEKRTKFSSWGGKRSDSSIENKRKFSSWAGKRGGSDDPFETLINQLYTPASAKTSYWDRGYRDGDVMGLIKQNEQNVNGGNYNQFDLETAYLPSEEYTGHWSSDDDNINEDKRSRFSSWGGKRKFSSWGGKRSISQDELSLLTEQTPEIDKRAKFSSWAGKRGLLPFWISKYQGKRGKFSSWAGKRSDPAIDIFDEQDKRGKFSSWGGKRGLYDENDSYGDKRTKFSSWAGKRFDEDNEMNAIDKREDNYMKKKIKGRGFSSWGGKRNYWEDDEMQTDFNNDLYQQPENEMKRANKFSSWAGKRSQDIEEEKRKFSSWGGKRDQDIEEEKRKFSSWGGKRSQDIEEEKRKFSSWGGKRDQDIEEEKRKFSSWGGKRNYLNLMEEPKRSKFSSWAGKRSVDHKERPKIKKKKEDRDKSGLLRRYNRFNSWRGKKNDANSTNSTQQTKLDDVNFNQTTDNLNVNKSKRGFNNYLKQFEMIKRNPLLRAWIDRNYPDIMTWKRRPAFSSWGGKRSLTQEYVGEIPQLESDYAEEKRGKFSSWGGKRHYIQKRSTKSTAQQILNKISSHKQNQRKPKLSGRRTALESHFYLRSSKDSLLASALRPMRRQFYAWGGKRAHS